MLRALRRAVVPVLILAGAAGGFMLLRATGPEAPPSESQERTWPVRALTVEPTSHRPTVLVNGRVHSAQDALLRAAVEGEVDSVPARAGERVAAGDELVRIDPREAELRLDQRVAERREQEGALAREELRARFDRQALARERELAELAERSLQRARDLRVGNLGSEADVDSARERLEQARLSLETRERTVDEADARMKQAEAGLERARAAEAQARIDLARTTIRAPFDARIVEVDIAAGERARPGDPLLQLFALDDLEVRASIPADVVPQVERLLADGAELPADARVGGRDVETELVRMAGETRTGEAGLRGVFAVQSGGAALALNRFVELRLRLPAEPDSIVVPFEALFGRDQVFRIADGRLESLTVERLGEFVTADGETRALVRSPDISAGDTLLATRLPNAVDGLRVEVQAEDDQR